MERKRCGATNQRGEPCRSTIILDSGYCRGHDPSYAQDRKRAASRNGMQPQDPELKELRSSLKKLMKEAGDKKADHFRIELQIKVARARAYVIRIDYEIRRSSAEIAELEDAYDELLSDYEALRDGKAPGPQGWYLRKEAAS